jgi:hypothetical protein
MLALAALGVLVGVAIMLVIFGNEMDRRLDDRVTQVQRNFDASLNRVREDVRQELDATGTAPTAPPAVTPTPTPFGTATPEAGTELTPDPTVEGTATPDDTGQPTPTPTIQP